MNKTREKQIIDLIESAKATSGKSLTIILRLDTKEEVDYAIDWLKGKRGGYKNVQPKLRAKQS